MINSKQVFPPQCTQLPGLNALVSEIVEELPSFKYTSLANSEIDYYGASYNIARSLGLKGIPYTRASWHHGWYRYPLTKTELIIDENRVAFCNIREVPNLVASKDMETFLRDNEYPNAIAVGDPMLYTFEPKVERIPGSLLVVPEHSIKETNINIEQGHNSVFPDTIDNLKSKFSTVVACIGGFCATRKNYVKTFEDHGFPWITGAWLHDQLALQRIRNLFSQFEYVATNAMGSHIPYAGYCGCKVSYYGKGQNLEPKDLVEIPVYKMFPKLIEIVINENKLEILKEKYSFLFSTIENSATIEEWSKNKLGLENKILHHELAKLIGWKIRQKDENSWEYIPGANPGLVMNN